MAAQGRGEGAVGGPDGRGDAARALDAGPGAAARVRVVAVGGLGGPDGRRRRRRQCRRRRRGHLRDRRVEGRREAGLLQEGVGLGF